MDVEQLVDACIGHTHVGSLELQVRDLSCYPSTKGFTETFIVMRDSLRPLSPYWHLGHYQLDISDISDISDKCLHDHCNY